MKFIVALFALVAVANAGFAPAIVAPVAYAAPYPAVTRTFHGNPIAYAAPVPIVKTVAAPVAYAAPIAYHAPLAYSAPIVKAHAPIIL